MVPVSLLWPTLLEQGVGLDNIAECLPTSTLYDSVIPVSETIGGRGGEVFQYPTLKPRAVSIFLVSTALNCAV